ncbi:MAG: hypothetical protein AAFY42_11535 [Pseudomonadota bacterium]
MKKHIVIGSALTVALGLAACTPPAESEGDGATEEAAEAVEEEAAVDGTMTEDASAEEGGGKGGDTTGPDEDGNPIHD